MKKYFIVFVLYMVLFKGIAFAGVITTACPDEEGGKYNHCRPETRGCEPGFEENRDGAGNTNQDCTDRLYSSGAQKAICCQIKPATTYVPAIGTCPTVRSDGFLNYCRPGVSCGSYSPTSSADNDACGVYLYNAAASASCCKSPYTVPVGAASGTSKVTGKYYLDANGDKAFNTGDSAIENQKVSLASGQSTTSDSSGDFKLENVPLGGNTITFGFDKGTKPVEFHYSITVAGAGLVYDHPLDVGKSGGTTGGGGGGTTPATVDIRKIIEKISEAKIREYMTNLVDDDTAAGSDELQSRWSSYDGNGGRPRGNKTEAEYVKSHFETLGLETSLQAFSIGASVQTNNVIGRIPGSTSDVILVTSHLDSRGDTNGTGNSHAPGADDNASGTVLVMEVARALKESGITPKASIEFITFSGEEQGLVGSEYYAANIPAGKTVKGVINSDMIGNKSGGDCAEFLYLRGGLGSALSAKIVEANSIYSLGLSVTSKEANESIPGAVITRSDQWPFLAKGIPATFGMECVMSPEYHSPDDKMNLINFSQITKIAKAVAAVTASISTE